MRLTLDRATVLAIGEYDFEGQNGERYSYLDLYDPEARNPREAIFRVSVAKDTVLPDVSMGEELTVVCEATNSEKIVRGEERDRAFHSIKLRAVEVAKAKPAPVEKPVKAVA